MKLIQVKFRIEKFNFVIVKLTQVKFNHLFQPTFLYGGPENPKKVETAIPTFEKLIKKRILCEKRFYCNNSNSKWISVGIVPATKLLDESAVGFYLEVSLGGESCEAMPLGGAEGAASLFSTIRQIPEYNKVQPFHTQFKNGKNITIGTVNWNDDVSSFIFMCI